jgi:hypothetical protein
MELPDNGVAPEDLSPIDTQEALTPNSTWIELLESAAGEPLRIHPYRVVKHKLHNHQIGPERDPQDIAYVLFGRHARPLGMYQDEASTIYDIQTKVIRAIVDHGYDFEIVVKKPTTEQDLLQAVAFAFIVTQSFEHQTLNPYHLDFAQRIFPYMNAGFIKYMLILKDAASFFEGEFTITNTELALQVIDDMLKVSNSNKGSQINRTVKRPHDSRLIKKEIARNIVAHFQESLTVLSSVLTSEQFQGTFSEELHVRCFAIEEDPQSIKDHFIQSFLEFYERQLAQIQQGRANQGKERGMGIAWQLVRQFNKLTGENLTAAELQQLLKDPNSRRQIALPPETDILSQIQKSFNLGEEIKVPTIVSSRRVAELLQGAESTYMSTSCTLRSARTSNAFMQQLLEEGVNIVQPMHRIREIGPYSLPIIESQPANLGLFDTDVLPLEEQILPAAFYAKMLGLEGSDFLPQSFSDMRIEIEKRGLSTLQTLLGLALSYRMRHEVSPRAWNPICAISHKELMEVIFQSLGLRWNLRSRFQDIGVIKVQDVSDRIIGKRPPWPVLGVYGFIYPHKGPILNNMICIEPADF